ISEVRVIGNTSDADAKLVGNERADIVGGKGCFDSLCLFAQCQVTDDHEKPPSSCMRQACDQARPSNPPRNVALYKNLKSVVIAPHLLEKICRLASVRAAFGARCRDRQARCVTAFGAARAFIASRGCFFRPLPSVYGLLLLLWRGVGLSMFERC